MTTGSVTETRGRLSIGAPIVAGLNQRSSGDPFEDPQRRALLVDHRSDRHQQRLLELILPGHGRMAHLIGERDPGRSCRKLDASLDRTLLVLGVRLHQIMKLKHQGVVSRPCRLRDSQQSKGGGGTWQWHCMAAGKSVAT